MNQQERWQTPPEIFEPLMREFDFDLDAAADEQTFRFNRYLTPAWNSSMAAHGPGRRSGSIRHMAVNLSRLCVGRSRRPRGVRPSQH